MKKSISAVCAALFLAASASAFADSTHECQGNSCNGGGTVTGTVTSTNNNTNIVIPTTTSSSTATGGAGGTGIGIGGNSSASSSATGGNGTGIGIGGNQSQSANSSSGGNTVTGGAQSMSSTNGGNSVRGGDVNVNTNVRPAASAPAVGLTSVGSFNCLGSAGVSFGTGFFSGSVGSTTESVECNRRANAVMAPGGSEGPVGQALLCMNEEYRAAKKLVGDLCPQDVQAAKQASAAPTSREAKIAAAQALKDSGADNVGMDVNLPASSANRDPIVCERTGERC
jgi:hypothetical protein